MNTKPKSKKLKEIAVRVHPEDNVATAIINLEKGTKIADGSILVTLKSEIFPGHKFALTDILRGSPVIKYGQTIGNAMKDINVGDWVHEHNVEGRRGRGDLNKQGR